MSALRRPEAKLIERIKMADNVDHLAFLLQRCELELIHRDHRATVRSLKAANFPNDNTLDAFDFKEQPSISKVLVTELIEAREERSLLHLRKQFARLDLLIPDELDYMPASKIGSELLFDVISAACELQNLTVMTNLPFENWTEVLSCERLTTANLDRVTHRCHILQASGQSFRFQDARRRKPLTDSSRGSAKSK